MVISPVRLFSTITKQHRVFLVMPGAMRRRKAACRRHRTTKL
ncbi:hypothetical protein [uncultured Nostoc sp.]